MRTLYPHQRGAVNYLTRQRAGLFDEQGLGKTTSALTALDALWRRSPAPTVIVAPSVVLYHWRREALEVMPWLLSHEVFVRDKIKQRIPAEAKIVITSHGLLAQADVYQDLERFAPYVVIGDETHMFRNMTAKRSRRFYALAKHAHYAWALTGTPMVNWPLDLWSFLHNFYPDRFPETREEFRDRYHVTAASDFGDGVRILQQKNIGELRKRMDGLFRRRQIQDVLKDLPSIRYETLVLDEARPQEVLDLEKEISPAALRAVKAGENAEEAYAELLDHTDLSKYRRLCGEAKAKAVSDLVKLELTDQPLAKRVIFCHHRAVASEIASRLSEFQPVVITGASTAAQRDGAVKKFQRERQVQVAVCQLDAAGTGITLTASHDVIFAEQAFSPGTNAQAARRCYRIGQKHPVRIRYAVLDGTVDEIVGRILARKTEAISETLVD